MLRGFAARKKRGFTLIELAASLLVASLVVAVFLGLYQALSISEKKEITQERVQYIKKAIAAHINRYGDYPCPARKDLTPGSAGFGIENVQDDGDGIPNPPDTCKTFAATTNPAFAVMVASGVNSSVIAGAVPTKTLNIADKYMLDGWGNQFTYIISGTVTDGAINETKGNIKMLDGNDPGSSPRSLSDGPYNPIYAIISHGPDGKGTYSRAGKPTVAACGTETNTDERDNFNCNFTNRQFMNGAFSPNNKSSTAQKRAYFDDIVDYGITIPGVIGNHCHQRLKFYAPDNPAADVQGCVGNVVTFKRWDIIPLACDTTKGSTPNPQPGPASNNNCATARFSNANILETNFTDGVNEGLVIFDSDAAPYNFNYTAIDDGLLRIRATIPVVTTNPSIGWKEAIHLGVFVDNKLIGVGLLNKPMSGQNPSPGFLGGTRGRTGIFTAETKIKALQHYNVQLRLMAFKSDPGATAWAGTIRLQDYNVDGFVEVMEQTESDE